jgi:PAS domain S-box-containing protein
MSSRQFSRTTNVDIADTLLSAIIDSTDDAILSIDLQGKITSWNRGAEQLYRIPAHEALHADLSELLPSSARDLLALVGDAEAGVPVHRETERSLRDGRKVLVEETVSTLKDEGGSVVGVASISRDVGSRREIELALASTQRELELRNARLEQSNADLEQFAYVASHDLSEPLRAISGMVELLRQRYRDHLDEDANTFIDFAVEGCVRMRTMIEDLLSYSRVGTEGLHLDSTEVRVLVDRAIDSLRSEVGSSGAVVTIGDLPTLMIDDIKIGQVIQNLLSNSIKFRRSDQQVHIHVSAQPLQDGDWKIEVSDNGIGIDPRHRTRVFRMFQRLHNRDTYPGTGIGLAISERIVNAHGGTMGLAESTSGGTCAWFIIPNGERSDV